MAIAKMKLGADGKMEKVKSSQELTREWQNLKQGAIDLGVSEDDLAGLDGLKKKNDGKLGFDTEAGGKKKAIESIKQLLDERRNESADLSEGVDGMESEGGGELTSDAIDETDLDTGKKEDEDSEPISAEPKEKGSSEEAPDSPETEGSLEEEKEQMVQKVFEKAKDKIEAGIGWKNLGTRDKTKEQVIKLLARDVVIMIMKGNETLTMGEDEVVELVERVIGE